MKLGGTGTSPLSKFGRIPATLTITRTYNGYSLAATPAKVTFKR